MRWILGLGLCWGLVWSPVAVALDPTQAVQDTLARIEATEKELSDNEKAFEQKLSALRQKNPLFAEKDAFESDKEYLARMAQAMPQVDRMRKQMLGDVQTRLERLRGTMFETTNIVLTAKDEDYDPNTEIWKMSVESTGLGATKLDFSVKVEKPQARLFRQNKDKVQASGYLAIDPGDRPALVKVSLLEPISSTKIEREFPVAWATDEGQFNGPVKFLPREHVVGYTNFEEYPRALIWHSLRTRQSVSELPSSGELIRSAGVVAVRDHEGAITLLEESRATSSFRDGLTEWRGGVGLSIDRRYVGVISGGFDMFGLEQGRTVWSLNAQKTHTYGTVSFSSDGSLVSYSACSGSRDFDLQVVRINDGGPVLSRSSRSVDRCSSIFIPGTRILVTTAHEGDEGLEAFDIDSQRVIWRASGGEGMAVSPNGRLIANSNRLLDARNGKVLKEFPWKLENPDFSYDTRYMVGTINEGKQVVVLRTLVDPILDESGAKQVSAPPKLVASAAFSEPSGNNVLDALEKGTLALTLKNDGGGAAHGIIVKITPDKVSGLNYTNSFVDTVEPGATKTVKIPLEAYMDVADGTQKLHVAFEEANGFPPTAIDVQFNTRAYQKPELKISDIGVEDANGNGLVESGEMVKVTVRVTNGGAGPANGVFAKFYGQAESVFVTDKFPRTQPVGELAPGSSKDLTLEFFINDRASTDIPLFVDLTEATNLASATNQRLPLSRTETRRTQSLIVAERTQGTDSIAPDLGIDIEKEIPTAGSPRSNAIAVVLGVEQYKNVSGVSFAARDAAFVKEYFVKKLGIPADQVYFKTNGDVTQGELRKLFDRGGWLEKRAAADREIFVYYAGHGAPTLDGTRSYLIPHDGDPNYAEQTGYEVSSLMANLKALPKAHAWIFLDACFSGLNREAKTLLADARPVGLQAKLVTAASDVSVLSASSGAQVSSAYPEKKHGLFTYFLLKGLRGEADVNADGNIDTAELGGFITREVSRQAGLLDREQTPAVSTEQPERVLTR